MSFIRPTTAAQLLDLLGRNTRVYPPALHVLTPVLVTPDACELIVAAASELADHTTLDPSMVGPYDRALYFFPRTLHRRDDMPASAIDGFALATADDGSLVASIFMVFEDQPDLQTMTWSALDLLLEHDLIAWPWGYRLDRFLDIEQSDTLPADLIADRLHDRKIIAATLLLAAQPITSVDPGHTDRHARRRAERRFKRMPDVRTLTLRTSTGTRHDSSGLSAHFDHRFVVRGHWRNQPFGPKQSLRRPTWLAPHIKGPADAPLDTRRSAWKLTGPEAVKP